MLKPPGRTIPCGVEFHAAALESADLRGRIDFWSSPRAGFDVASARAIAVNTGYPAFLEPAQLLSAPALVATASLPPADGVRPISGRAAVTVSRAGRLDGIAAWSAVELAPGIMMTNSPLDARRIGRRQAMLPLDRPIEVEPGDRIDLALHVIPQHLIVTWSGTVTNDRGRHERFRQTTFNGMLMTDEDRLTTNPEWRPQLTPAGEARRTLLELCDGGHALREIEVEVLRRHRDLLVTEAAAAAFVAEVLTVYGLTDRVDVSGR
jgi:hypothetical protein